MKVENIPLNAVEVVENLFISPDGDAYGVRVFKFKGRRITLYKQKLNKSAGYKVIQFRGKEYTIHRLVATAFCHKPSEDLVVNHKDGNKLNNSCTNLEWITHAENARHASATGLHIGSNHKKIKQLSLDGMYVKEHDSIADAARSFNTNNQASAVASIHQTLDRPGRSAYGFRWAYA